MGFCNDFGILLSKLKITTIFRKVSPTQQNLSLEQFKEAIPLLAMEYAKARHEECKYRLQMIKFVIEFPTNSKFKIHLNQTIFNLVNEVSSTYDNLGRKIKSKKQKKIEEFINLDQKEVE